MNTGKVLTEVRSPQRQLAPDDVGPEQGEPTFLRGIANKARNKQQHRFRDLYRCLNEELIYDAWKSLNKGAASGVDRVTAEAYAEDLQGNIQRLVERLKAKREPAPRSALGMEKSLMCISKPSGMVLRRGDSLKGYCEVTVQSPGRL